MGARHGRVGTREYNAWAGMVDRCYNKNSRIFKFYGGRGITMCPEFRAFKDFFALMGECPEGMSIDRIDNNGNYQPGNVRWASKKTQARNRRSNRFLTHKGKTMTVAEWSEETGLSSSCIFSRMYRYRWPIAETLDTPRMSLSEIGKLGGIARQANG